MSLTTTITDLIAEAHRVLSAPVSLDGWQPPELETHEQYAAEEEEETDRRMLERLATYIANRADGLAYLRAVRAAAEAAYWKEKARAENR